MNLSEMKKKVLGMIEELNPNSELLTDDPDISAKINAVINQVMFELVRMKKIPKYVEMEVSAGDIIEFADIEKECGYEIYQIALVSGVDHLSKAGGTVIKVLEAALLRSTCMYIPNRSLRRPKTRPMSLN